MIFILALALAAVAPASSLALAAFDHVPPTQTVYLEARLERERGTLCTRFQKRGGQREELPSAIEQRRSCCAACGVSACLRGAFAPFIGAANAATNCRYNTSHDVRLISFPEFIYPMANYFHLVFGATLSRRDANAARTRRWDAHRG